MLFTIDKNKSLAFLQAVMALFIVLAPTALAMLPAHSDVYALFIVFALVFLMRIKKTQRVYFSPMHFVLLAFFCYTLISSIWAKNKEGHLLYIFITAAAVFFLGNAIDYFKESNCENLRRRMMYLFLSSGTLCALINVSYWLLYIIPVAGKEAFSYGIGSNDFLAVFMLICMMCAICLIRSTAPSRRKMLIPMLIIMLFVFVMAKSLTGWVMALLICIIAASSKQSEKMFLPISLISVVILAGIAVAASTLMPWGDLSGDLFALGCRHPFGSGGGVISAQALYGVKAYPKDSTAGLMAMLFAQSGIVGLICCGAVILRVLTHFFKLKNIESLISLFILTLLMILPFGKNYAVFFLWIGLFAYNENSLSMCVGRNVKKDFLQKMIYLLAAFSAIAAVLFAQCFMRAYGNVCFENENYMSAYSVYRAAAAINIADSESCRMAAASLRKGADIKAQRDEAVALVDKAIKRDTGNLENTVEKARIYYACEEYDLCAQQYRIASQQAVRNEKYNLSLAKTLYKIVQKNPKGSSETKRAYEEILSVAQETHNLDYRKEINDIADKALIFTKGELASEENS